MIRQAGIRGNFHMHMELFYYHLRLYRWLTHSKKAGEL